MQQYYPLDHVVGYDNGHVARSETWLDETEVKINNSERIVHQDELSRAGQPHIT
jgi:hypothetical protein